MGGGVGVDGCDGCATTTIGVVTVGVLTADGMLMLVVMFDAGTDVTATETVVIVGDEVAVLDAGVVAGCGVVGGGAGDGVVGGATRGDSGGGWESSSMVPTPCA